jgi:hypothetical protein
MAANLQVGALGPQYLLVCSMASGFLLAAWIGNLFSGCFSDVSLLFL